jgi:four helix bundle protein
MERNNENPIRSYRDLIVWQKGMQLRRNVYTVVHRLPPEERFALGVQMRKASVSVPSNIAEGHARQIRRDYRQYLSMSRGSLAELETQLQVAWEENYVDDIEYRRNTSLADEVSRMLTTLIQRLRT